MNEDIKKTWASVKRGEVFSAMGGVPQDWEYRGGCIYVVPHHECALCETKINYQFPLTNKVTGKVLLIGRECVIHYYEAYQPSGLDIMLGMLDDGYKEARAGVVAQRLEQFKTEWPNLVAFLADKASKLKGFRRVVAEATNKESGIISHTIRSTSYYRASLKRKGYLKPEEIADIASNVAAWNASLNTVLAVA